MGFIGPRCACKRTKNSKNSHAMPPIAESIIETITASLRSTLKQEGLAKAREQWLVLNATMSTEDWWPAVARAVRQLFDDYADEQAQQQRLENSQALTPGMMVDQLVLAMGSAQKINHHILKKGEEQ